MLFLFLSVLIQFSLKNVFLNILKVKYIAGNEKDSGDGMEQSLWQQLEQSACAHELFPRIPRRLLFGRNGQWQVDLLPTFSYKSHFSYGRKTAIYGFSILSAIFGFLLIYSREFEIFLIIRFLLAASNEASDLAAYVLCMEVTGSIYHLNYGNYQEWNIDRSSEVSFKLLGLVATLFWPSSPIWANHGMSSKWWP